MNPKHKPIILDCTLRDGGYYTEWDFPADVIQEYLNATAAAGVDIVELGMRSLDNDGFKGPCAFTTDDFIRQFEIPDLVQLGVMVNASELLINGVLNIVALEKLFPEAASTSPINLVRIACHEHELVVTLPASQWLRNRGYQVGFNLMQISELTEQDIYNLAEEVAHWPVDVLYFADSLGDLDAERTTAIVKNLRAAWPGAVGIHAHDNMGLAQSNSLQALADGVSWIDATVSGMGRGPGNTRTELLVLEVCGQSQSFPSLAPLLTLIRRYFDPIRKQYGWGTNTYYYLAAKHGIHPSYVQKMLADSRYDSEDIISVIEHLKVEGARHYSADRLEFARHFYPSEPAGSWDPAEELTDRDVLILGAGLSATIYADAVKALIERDSPVVLALNTQKIIDDTLVDYRAACHPIRLLADIEEHLRLDTPLITPVSMLPTDIAQSLNAKVTRDYGLNIQPGCFKPQANYAILPNSLVIAYALAVAARGGARRVYLVGFDGYGPNDPRTHEVARIFSAYENSVTSPPLISLTPTEYSIRTQSIYSPILD